MLRQALLQCRTCNRKHCYDSSQETARLQPVLIATGHAFNLNAHKLAAGVLEGLEGAVPRVTMKVCLFC